MPLVNTYSVKEKFPLSVNRCVKCCHLQLSEFVDPEILYSDYTYCSGTGRTALEYFANFAREAVAYAPDAKRVMDIACNDGSQLDAFKALGLTTWGVDPALNLHPISCGKGHFVYAGFFENPELIEVLAQDSFDIITAQNVLAHTPRPMEFLKNCARIMHDGSKLFVATSQANLIVNGEVDSCYHEHCSYFNAHSMTLLAERAGLTVLDIIMHDIHGTSYVFVLGKKGEPSERVINRLEWELLIGLLEPSIYRWWAKHVKEKIQRVGELIVSYANRGYFTVGCGAAAKGISMLNMARVKLDVLADNTPTKIGRTTSGMRIMGFAEISNLTQDKVLFVLLAWNVARELRENILKLRDNAADVFIEAR